MSSDATTAEAVNVGRGAEAEQAIQFYDTPSRRKRPFETIEAGRVKMYSCGPTVWDFSHIGNFRCFLFYDVLKRYLKYRGYHVEHVMNLTDIDDRIVERVNASGGGLEDYVRTYIQGFYDDLDALRIERADRYPRATEHIADMVALIERLIERGVAYERDGSVYFSIARFPAYGEFAHLDKSGLRDGARIDSDRYDKDDVRDFVLWKAWTEADGDVAWDSPWGRGRPGWHLECSCMSMKYLGESFDLHAGGVDLIFPHHQNEIAQSEGATGKPFARYWMHNEFVNIDGVKLSKSLGNHVRLADIAELVDAAHRVHVVAGFRYFVVTNHYRTTLNFSAEALDAAIRARLRLNRCYARLLAAADGVEQVPEHGDWAARVTAARQGFVEAMDDDLNAARAMAAVFGLVGAAEKELGAGGPAAAEALRIAHFLLEVDAVLGVLDDGGAPDPATEASPELPADLAQLVADREAARAARDWALADSLRDRLAAAGVTVIDTPDGSSWTRSEPG